MYSVGILVAGGFGSDSFKVGKSVEVFIPKSGKRCSLSNLPEERYDSTLDTVAGVPILCGGHSQHSSKLTSCLQLTPVSASGVWTKYATTRESRRSHSSWISSTGLVLMGGDYKSGRSSRLNYRSTEIVPSLTSGVGNFSLLQKV